MGSTQSTWGSTRGGFSSSACGMRLEPARAPRRHWATARMPQVTPVAEGCVLLAGSDSSQARLPEQNASVIQENFFRGAVLSDGHWNTSAKIQHCSSGADPSCLNFKSSFVLPGAVLEAPPVCATMLGTSGEAAIGQSTWGSKVGDRAGIGQKAVGQDRAQSCSAIALMARSPAHGHVVVPRS